MYNRYNIKEDKYTRDLAKRMKSLTADDTSKNKKKKEKQIGSWKVVQKYGIGATVEDGFTSEYEAAKYVDEHGGVGKLKVVKENVYDRLENSIVRIYEGLYRQVKENIETSDEETSLKDLEMKIDVIMDALGLKEEEEKEETVETTDEVIEETPPVEFEEKEETKTTEEIPEE